MKDLRGAGLAILALGIAWDLAYHSILLLRGSDLPPALDLLGNLGHLVTLAGIVILVLYFIRSRPA